MSAIVRVLVVDDSVVVRRVVTRVLSEDAAIDVVGTAPDGRIALEKIAQLKPDLVVLDIEMPEMDGLAALARIRNDHPEIPVIMFSILTERAASHTLDALSLGAVDYVTKPAGPGGQEEAQRVIREDLAPKIRAICCGEEVVAVAPPAAAPVHMAPDEPEIVAIAASTGGPDALPRLLSGLPKDFSVPILVVQHMPALFTKLFAQRLDTQVPIAVAEGVAGTPLTGGHVWIAPGGFHLGCERTPDGVVITTHQGPPELSCRPSANILFRSAAACFGPSTLAVVMTGMGRDGLDGCQAVRGAGGRVFAQDRASSAVWGMPGFVVEAGLPERVLPPERLAEEILSLVSAGGAV